MVLMLGIPWSGIFANLIFVSDGILICENLLKNGSKTYFCRWCFSKVAKISDIMFSLRGSDMCL